MAKLYQLTRNQHGRNSIFRIIISKYENEDVFKIYKTGIFFWILPQKTYTKKETNQQARFNKGMKEKY